MHGAVRTGVVLSFSLALTTLAPRGAAQGLPGLGGAWVDPEILDMILQGQAPTTPVRVIVTFAGDATLQFPTLNAAYAGNAPVSTIQAICDAYATISGQNHAPFNALVVGLGGAPAADFWLIDAVAAAVPLGAIPLLANFPSAVRIGLDRYRQPGGLLLTDESTVLIGARDVNRLFDANGNPIVGTGVRLAIADTGIDLRTNQPSPGGMPGQCNPCVFPSPPNPSCVACCYLNPNAGGIKWPHGAFTRGDVNLASGIPDLLPHRIVVARDVGGEGFCGPPWTPATCPALTIDTAEDIAWRCGTNGPAPAGNNLFGHGTSTTSIAAGRRYPVIAGGQVQFRGADGVAPDADILFYKIVDDTAPGYGATEAMMASAVERALSDGARVFNLSFDGFVDPTGPLDVAIERAGLTGMLVCAIAGNCGAPGGGPNPCGPTAVSPACPVGVTGVTHGFYNGLIVGAAGKWNKQTGPPCPPQVADRVAIYSSRGPLVNAVWGTTRTGVNIVGPSRD